MGVKVARVLALDIADDPTAWVRLGFTIADGAVHLGGIVLRLVGPTPHGGGIRSWAISSGPDAVDGLAISAPPDHDPAMLPPSATVHANTAVVVDHLVIATPDLRATTTALEAQGWAPRRTISDPRGASGRTMRFFLAPTGTPSGRVLIEVVHDPAAGHDRTTFWGLAVGVSDLDAAVRRIGADLVGQPQQAVQPGRRIATIRGDRAAISVPLALMTSR